MYFYAQRTQCNVHGHDYEKLTIFMNVLDNVCPVRKVKYNDQISAKPWFTSGVRTACNKK